MQEVMNKIYEYIATYGLNVLAAALIFFIGRWLAGVVANLLEKMMNKTNLDATLATFVKNIAYVALLIFVFIAALGKLGVQTTSFIAVIGAAGLAVGLALQGSLANFAAGVLLIMFKPFKTGDFIEGAGTMGTVKEVHIFNTIISTPDNKKVIIPNAKITNDNITNFSAIDQRRIDLVFGISYDDDIRKAKEVLLGIISSDDRVLKDPEPVVAVSELGDSSVNMVCRPWVKPENYWAVRFDTLEKGKIELEAAGITIPFPQSDVHLFEKEK
ncbi:MAG: mechanosensitive ion channel [Candidatus Tantalella remota]|nr:mechanosensitive ion channel [Candidatus Tantalella remota]